MWLCNNKIYNKQKYKKRGDLAPPFVTKNEANKSITISHLMRNKIQQ
jgi:hypothetical protein